MESNTEKAVEPKRTVQKCDSLCAGEKEYIQQRKKKILESLKRNGINCELEDVPHIALLGSGGGQRAAVGLLGALFQLEQDDLLDTLLYILGLSGSTWPMVSLYKEPEMNVSRVIATQKGPSVGLGEAVAWMKERVKGEDFSLTHVWGALTSARVTKEMDKRRLSEDTKREATNPYPIYSAIEKHSNLHGPVEAAWFEMSPHQCGFSDLGLFVETSCLGSRFESGELVEERVEMDMVELQGILGCALADEQTIRDMMPDWMKVPEAEVLHPYLQAFQVLRTMVELSDAGPATAITLIGLDKVLQDKLKNPPLDPESSAKMTAEEKKESYEGWGLDFMKALEVWCDSLEDGPFKTHICWMIKYILPLVVKWQWGTVNNFLYKYEDSAVPASLQTRKSINLIDAGLMINAPYPPVLGSRRDVDLIIAPDFGAGDIFEIVEHTRVYSQKLKKAFPTLDQSVLAEKDQPKDFYVIQGQQSEPTILYMPLFNLQNCQDKEEIVKERDEYKTFQLPYSAEKIDRLLEKAKVNLKNNKQKILEQIEKAVQRRQQQRNSKVTAS